MPMFIEMAQRLSIFLGAGVDQDDMWRFPRRIFAICFVRDLPLTPSSTP